MGFILVCSEPMYTNSSLIPLLQYAAKEFGTCPLIQCSGQPVLPVGLKDEVGLERAKVFCPKCQCVYHPPPIRSRGIHLLHHSSNGGGGAVDGAAFGTTFPHLFLMTFNNLMPDHLPSDSAYIPKVFGYRIHKSAWQQGRGGYPNNNSSNRRRGPYTQRRLASMTTSKVAPAASAQQQQQQPTTNGGKDVGGATDNKVGKASAPNLSGGADAAPQPVEVAAKPESKETSTGVVVAEAADVNNGNEAGEGSNSNASKRKGKSDGGKTSDDVGSPKNRSPKRQKVADGV